MTLAITVLALSRIVDFRTGAVHLRLDPSIDRLLPQEDEGKKFYDHVRNVFGSDETLLIALISEDVFTTDVLESVVRITIRIEEIDGVHHVVSLSTALNIRSSDEDLEIEPFLRRIPEDQEGLMRFRNEALEYGI